jgi:hypothetical protein
LAITLHPSFEEESVPWKFRALTDQAAFGQVRVSHTSNFNPAQRRSRTVPQKARIPLLRRPVLMLPAFGIGLG